jgi:SAM-dependent methyltransferase
MRNYQNMERYLDWLSRDIYPEPAMPQHEEITENVFRTFIIPNQKIFNRVLDVGCGCGIALKRFKALRIPAVGITLGEDDYQECLKQGFEVRQMDQSFLDFPSGQFDLVYARHVLEHSPFPLITLFEFNRVSKNQSYLYVEIPWAESVHTTNPNHYSLFGKMGWRHLFEKACFSLLNDIKINFDLINGEKDEYWGWWLRKTKDLSYVP